MMNLQEEILKIKNEMIDEFDKRVEALKEEEQEFPQDGDVYWYIDSDGDVLNDEWGGFASEEGMLEIGNIFKAKDQAEFAVEKLKVEAELRKFGRPFECGKVNHCLLYDTDSDYLEFDIRNYYMTQGSIYFESAEKVRQAISEIGEERIKKYIFGVEDLIND